VAADSEQSASQHSVVCTASAQSWNVGSVTEVCIVSAMKTSVVTFRKCFEMKTVLVVTWSLKIVNKRCSYLRLRPLITVYARDGSDLHGSQPEGQQSGLLWTSWMSSVYCSFHRRYGRVHLVRVHGFQVRVYSSKPVFTMQMLMKWTCSYKQFILFITLCLLKC